MFCGTRGAGRWWWGGRGVITPGCEELWSRAPNREGVFSVALGEFFTRRARLAVHVDWTGGCQCAGPAHSALTIDRATAAKRSFRRERAALLIPLAGDSACPPHHTPTHLFFNKSIFKTFRGAVPRPTIVYIVYYNSCMSPYKIRLPYGNRWVGASLELAHTSLLFFICNNCTPNLSFYPKNSNPGPARFFYILL